MERILEEIEYFMYKIKDKAEDFLYEIYDLLKKIGVKKRREQNIIIILVIVLIISIIFSSLTISKKKKIAKKARQEAEQAEMQKKSEQAKINSEFKQYSFLNNELANIFFNGGFTSLKTYLVLLNDLQSQDGNSKLGIGKIELLNNVYVLEYDLEKEKEYVLKQDAGNSERILSIDKEIETNGKIRKITLDEYIPKSSNLNFDTENLKKINDESIQRGSLKIIDILVDDNDEKSKEVYDYLISKYKNSNLLDELKPNNNFNNFSNTEGERLKSEKKNKKILIQFKSEDKLYSEMEIKSGDTPKDPGIPFKSGYKFVGWNINISNALYEDTIIYAKWMKEEELLGKVVCIFNLNGGIGETQSQIINKGDIPKYIGTPTKEGYVFKGWSPDINNKVQEDTVFRAKWEKAD